MPAGYRDLAGHQQRSFLVAVFDDLQQVAALLAGQRLGAPVIDDQQPGALQHRQHARQSAFTLGGSEFNEQPRRAPIQHRKTFPAGFMPECAGWANDEQILLFLDPVALCQLLE